MNKTHPKRYMSSRDNREGLSADFCELGAKVNFGESADQGLPGVRGGDGKMLGGMGGMGGI